MLICRFVICPGRPLCAWAAAKDPYREETTRKVEEGRRARLSLKKRHRSMHPDFEKVAAARVSNAGDGCFGVLDDGFRRSWPVSKRSIDVGLPLSEGRGKRGGATGSSLLPQNTPTSRHRLHPRGKNTRDARVASLFASPTCTGLGLGQNMQSTRVQLSPN